MTIALPYHTVITGVFINGQITGAQMNELHAAFGGRPVTRSDLQDKVAAILTGWKPAVLKRCMARANAMFDKEDVRLSPPPMASEKDILRSLSNAMTIRITDRKWTKLLWYLRGPNLLVRYEYDGGHPDPWIPSAYYRDFTNLGGSRDAFVAFLESKGAKAGKGRG